MQSRIVNGVITEAKNWPWVAHLYIRSRGGQIQGCGGAFVSDDKIITAYHCVYDHLSRYYDITVMAGVNEGFSSSATSTAGLVPQEYEVTGIKVPSGANMNRYEQSDIAILTVRKVGSRSNSFQVTPICLPQEESPAVGRNCYVVGYGAASWAGSPTMQLMEAKVPIIADQTCKNKYDSFPMSENFNANVQICAGYANGYQDACQGDSGGPLMCQRENSCEWYLAGVVSYGWRCGVSYGVYAEVDAFADWVHQNTGIPKNPAEEKPCNINYGEQGCEALKFDGKLYQYDGASDSYVLKDPTLPKQTMFEYSDYWILKFGDKPDSGAGSDTIAAFKIPTDKVCKFDSEYQWYFTDQWVQTDNKLECATQD